MRRDEHDTSVAGAYDTPAFQTTLFPLPQSRPLAIREFLSAERPRNRLLQHGASALSDAELVAVITGIPCLETAQRLLIAAGGLRGLRSISTAELQRLVAGIGVGRAAQLKAAIELGIRVLGGEVLERRQIKSPRDVAELLMLEMSHLDQEHLRTVLLDTKNRVQTISTVYIGSLNTSMVRIGEVFKEALKRNSAALIVAHNHPSGDATPSPDDILVTREIVAAGILLDIDVLDHLIIGHTSWSRSVSRAWASTGHRRRPSTLLRALPSLLSASRRVYPYPSTNLLLSPKPSFWRVTGTTDCITASRHVARTMMRSLCGLDMRW